MAVLGCTLQCMLSPHLVSHRVNAPAVTLIVLLSVELVMLGIIYQKISKVLLPMLEVGKVINPCLDMEREGMKGGVLCAGVLCRGHDRAAAVRESLQAHGAGGPAHGGAAAVLCHIHGPPRLCAQPLPALPHG